MPRYIDISAPMTGQGDIDVTRQADPPMYLGHACYAWDLTIPSHTGTYFETSSHCFRDGTDTADVPIEDLFLDAAILRLPEDGPFEIDAPALSRIGAHVREGDAILVVTGVDGRRYFSRGAAQWLAAKRVKLFGADLARYDTGFENPTGFFIDLFKAEIPILANLCNLDRISRERVQLVVLPLPVQAVGTVPCRAVVIEA